jgi:hypothetical protein
VKAALLAAVLALNGCSICKAPAHTAVPAGVESAAFIDPAESCWTIRLMPEATVVAKLLVDILSMTLGTDGGGAWESR